jgi:hypothetical protein
MVTPPARPPGRSLPTRPESRVFVVEALGALAAEVAAASTVSQAVAGLGIAVAGVLPPPVQDVVAGAVEVVSPFDLPDCRGRRGRQRDRRLRHRLPRRRR